jgi:hypothetical protein
MTREQFIEASRKVRLYGNLSMGLTGSLAIILGTMLVLWAGPVMGNFGQLLRDQFQDEVTVGLIGGLIGTAVCAPLFLISLVPVLWMDRRFGLRCPGCGRSVTLRGGHAAVIRTGKCFRCREVLFKPR